MAKIELLAPAKNLEYGCEAVNHGADALYIGAPAFGARSAATNSIDDIDRLVRYAHLYAAKVYATVNTILFDDEIEPALSIIRQLYNCGVDALIVQDMGLLECGLPPIELHASTQCHNASVDKVRFLREAGFKRVILARETSIAQMCQISQAVDVELEAFVHGALCVSYSGQCYMSQYLNGRSGNRGCCSQPCRSSYDLYNGSGEMLLSDRHLLSLKDFNASRHLKAMIDAGISSLKIEGRLKDIGYLKNVTAYYRTQLDAMLGGGTSSSSGKCAFFFTPDVERTFNRGFTDYFLRGRQPMASFATQKSMGKRIGKVVAVGRNSITIDGTEALANGDGLCYFDADGRLQGFLVNNVNGRTVIPNAMPSVNVGTAMWRNNDQRFEKQLSGRTAERKIEVRMTFVETENGFALHLEDEDCVVAESRVDFPHEESRGGHQRSSDMIVKQLSKLGDTPFAVANIDDTTQGRFFLPAAVLNQLRRDAVEALQTARVAYFHPANVARVDSGAAYPQSRLDYKANVVNSKAEEFYQRHSAVVVERGLEQTADYEGKALMTTKYCLRYELGCCLCGKNKGKPMVNVAPGDTLCLHNNGKRFRLEFDCRECVMRIYAQ